MACTLSTLGMPVENRRSVVQHRAARRTRSMDSRAQRNCSNGRMEYDGFTGRGTSAFIQILNLIIHK